MFTESVLRDDKNDCSKSHLHRDRLLAVKKTNGLHAVPPTIKLIHKFYLGV